MSVQETRKPRDKVSIARNRQAHHEYEISDVMEAGIELMGSEVKSIRAGKVNLTDAWIDATDAGELWLKQAHISPYAYAHLGNHPAERPRRLLVKRKDIDKYYQAVQQKGYTLIALEVLTRGPWIKVAIGLGRGKKLHDKRRTSQEKDAKRDMARELNARG